MWSHHQNAIVELRINALTQTGQSYSSTAHHQNVVICKEHHDVAIIIQVNLAEVQQIQYGQGR